jgi:hypothetical protein
MYQCFSPGVIWFGSTGGIIHHSPSDLARKQYDGNNYCEPACIPAFRSERRARLLEMTPQFQSKMKPKADTMQSKAES